jgi:hypothetical protein
LTSEDLLLILAMVFVVTMYIRVELDFKRNLFRVAGHFVASVLLLLIPLDFFQIVANSILLGWFLLCSIFLMINEVIRIYLRRHSMKDILENHPTLYWLTRGKIRKEAIKNKEPAANQDSSLNE